MSTTTELPADRHNSQARPLLFSLKPYYADLVFEGLKKAELRRRIASGIEGRDVFIYVSSPVKQLRGGFRVGEVWQGSPEEIWNKISACDSADRSELAGVDKQGFDNYYEGREIAYALQIMDVWEYENPVDLSKLRNRFPNFVAPQSWRYVKPEEYQSFLNMKRQIKESKSSKSVLISQERHSRVAV